MAKKQKLQRDFKRCPKLEDMYDFFNEEFFDGRLPRMYVGYATCKENKRYVTYGYTGFRMDTHNPEFIAINKKTRNWWNTCLQTLLHEMAHVSVKDENDPHGPKFRKEMRRLIKDGAFDPLL